MATRINQAQLTDALKRGGSATDAYQEAKRRQLTQSEGLADRDAALRNLITGKDMDQTGKQEMLTRQITEAERMRGKYGQNVPVNVEGVSVGAYDPIERLIKERQLSKPSLTPAQEQAERLSGKKLSDWETAGGRPVAEQNLKQIGEVASDIQQGKRDTYDRVVGGITSGFPTLMGMVAPSEKGRRDKVRNTAVMLARQSDPNPTQKQIEDIMGQIYDPSSNDATNAQRLADYQEKLRSTASQMDQAASNLQTSGYAMPGLAGNPSGVRIEPAPVPQSQSGGLDEARARRLQELRAKKAAGQF